MYSSGSQNNSICVNERESEFGLERNDWFYKGSNQTVKSGANNTLETLWLH